MSRQTDSGRQTDLAINGRSTAEAHLWLAVIVRTIHEWRFGPLRLKQQAEHYLFKDRTDFRFVCQAAGMDVGRLRAKLAKLRDHAGHNTDAIEA